MSDDGALQAGTPIEVRNRYLGNWSTGFEIHACTDEGCVIRRSSDGVILGGVVPFDEIRLGPVVRRQDAETQSPGATSVLVVEDNEAVRFSIADILRKSGYAVSEATDGLSALGIVTWVPVDVLLLDLAMPIYHGRFVLKHIDPVPPVVVVYSGFAYENPEEIRQEVRSKVFRYVRKPVQPSELVAVIGEALDEARGGESDLQVPVQLAGAPDTPAP